MNAITHKNRAITNAVTNPAPALSAFVAGTAANGSSEVVDVPADGFPSLVPPVVFVTSGAAKLISVDWMTDSADIC